MRLRDTMKITTWMTMGLLALGLGACGGTANVGTGGGGSGASGGSGGSGAAGGSGAQGGAGGQGGGQGGAGGQGGGSLGVCGGEAGEPCPVDEYCDFQPSTCGGDDSTGICKLIPQIGCPEVDIPTCGCDGNVYGNECEAAAAGVDIDVTGSCTPPSDEQFACGAGFCWLGTEYCQWQISDVAGVDDEFQCFPLPTGCSGPPDCSCLVGAPCGNVCEGTAATGLTLTCAGA